MQKGKVKQAVSEKIRFYTHGYPFLVSLLCKWIDERGGRQWNVRNVENAEKELLNNDNTLFDDMIKNIENNKELKQIVTNILLEGRKLLCVKSDPAINMGMMFGILSDKENMVCISNIIFETYLYNHVIAGKMREQYNYVEPETRDNTRMDVVISYGGREYIVELKIYRGQKYRQKGLEQLEKYLDSRNSQKEVYEIVV